MTLCTLSSFIFTANATFFNREHPLLRAAALFVLNSDTTEHAHYVDWCALIRIKRINYEAAHLWDHWSSKFNIVSDVLLWFSIQKSSYSVLFLVSIAT